MKNHITCTFIGHATLLLKIGETTILTDPLFSSKVLFFKRKRELTFDPTKLPNLSAILISHAHYDHLNTESFKFIKNNIPVILPEKCSRSIEHLITNPTIELSHYASHQLKNGTTITSLPQKHNGGHFDRIRFYHSDSYIINIDDKTIFFCADSSYSHYFKEIGDLYKIDLAILPIGGYSPRFLFKGCHMTPKEAVNAFKDLKAKNMIPIHWGSFSFSLEGLRDPKKDLERVLDGDKNIASRIHIIEPGTTLEL